MEPGTLLQLDEFFITTRFLRLHSCNKEEGYSGSGNQTPIHFMFSKTTLEIRLMAIVNNWVAHSVFPLAKLSTQWHFKSAGVPNKMENAFSINNAAHSVLFSLDPFADSKKKKKNQTKKESCVVLSHKSQTPLERALYFSQWQREDLKFEMQDLRGVFYDSQFFSFSVLHWPSATSPLRVKILKVSHIDPEYILGD